MAPAHCSAELPAYLVVLLLREKTTHWRRSPAAIATKPLPPHTERMLPARLRAVPIRCGLWSHHDPGPPRTSICRSVVLRRFRTHPPPNGRLRLSHLARATSRPARVSPLWPCQGSDSSTVYDSEHHAAVLPYKLAPGPCVRLASPPFLSAGAAEPPSRSTPQVDGSRGHYCQRPVTPFSSSDPSPGDPFPASFV